MFHGREIIVSLKTCPWGIYTGYSTQWIVFRNYIPVTFIVIKNDPQSNEPSLLHSANPNALTPNIPTTHACLSALESCVFILHFRKIPLMFYICCNVSRIWISKSFDIPFTSTHGRHHHQPTSNEQETPVYGRPIVHKFRLNNTSWPSVSREKFENTKVVMKCNKSKEIRQHNGRKKKDKKTNNQTTTQTSRD